MQEDKQIYTTARSEEIKRQIKEYWSWVKEQKRKIDLKSRESTKTTIKSPAPKPEAHEKRQNVMIEVDSRQIDSVGKNIKIKQKSLFVEAEKRQKLFTFLTYVLFVFILGFVVLSIYLVNFVR